jgi:hypothetical protein
MSNRELPASPFELQTASGEAWRPVAAEVERWPRSYPGVDIPQEFARMRAWLISNPKKGKTAKGMARFVNNWLANAQDNPRGGNERPGRRATTDASYIAANPGIFTNRFEGLS